MMSDEFKIQNIKDQTCFSRDRKINFLKLIMLIMSMIKRTSQVEIDDIIKKLGFKKTFEMTYSKQAFSEARQKLLPKAFEYLTNCFIQNYYSDGDFKKYKKFLLCAIDGCVHEIPNTIETQEKYGYATNGNKDFKIARALTGGLYELENGFMLSSVFERYDSSERENAKILIEKALKLIPESEELLILFDRGYPSMDFINYLMSKKIHFLMRVSSTFCEEVISTNSCDEWVDIEITKERAKDLKKQGTILKVGTKLRVRVIKVVLNTGEVETLITDLSEDELAYEEAKDLYFRRWGIETKYDELKNKFQIENYSGEKPIIIEQDFYSTIFLSNLASLLEQDAEELANERISKKELKYEEYRINRSILVGKIKCDLFEIILEENNDIKKKLYDQLIKDISRNIVPVVKNRIYPRKKERGKSNKYSKARKRSF